MVCPMPTYDPEKRRRTYTRPKSGERGIWVYVPAAELARLKPSVADQPPYFRVRAREGGNSALLYFYTES